MARITIEDCMEKVPNRFQLVQMASIRAKQLKKGARPLLTSEDNKEVVMALREIAAGVVKPGELMPPAEETAAPAVNAPLGSSGASSEPMPAASPVESPTE